MAKANYIYDNDTFYQMLQDSADRHYHPCNFCFISYVCNSYLKEIKKLPR